MQQNMSNYQIAKDAISSSLKNLDTASSIYARLENADAGSAKSLGKLIAISVSDLLQLQRNNDGMKNATV